MRMKCFFKCLSLRSRHRSVPHASECVSLSFPRSLPSRLRTPPSCMSLHFDFAGDFLAFILPCLCLTFLPCVLFGTQTLPLVSRVMFHVASAPHLCGCECVCRCLCAGVCVAYFQVGQQLSDCGGCVFGSNSVVFRRNL